MTEPNDKKMKRVYYWNGETVAEIRHDSLFASPARLSGFVWDYYKDVEV